MRYSGHLHHLTSLKTDTTIEWMVMVILMRRQRPMVAETRGLRNPASRAREQEESHGVNRVKS